MTIGWPRWKAGHPLVRIVMKSIDHIGQEFFRFEIATAVAGAVLCINRSTSLTRDAKIKTRELTVAFEKSARCLQKSLWCQPRRPISTPTTRMPRRCARPVPMAISAPGSKPSGSFRRGRLCALLSPISNAIPHHIAALQQMGLRCATSAMSQPAPNSARLPAFHRAGLQGRARQRRISADHIRRCQGPRGARKKASFGVIKAAQPAAISTC